MGLESIVPHSRRLWAALFFGNDRNNTLLLEMQLRALKGLDPRYDHVTLVTPDVELSLRQEIAQMGSTVVQIAPIELPQSIKNNSAILQDGSTLGQVWAYVFTKLVIWNMTMYEQVALIDTDAFVTPSMQSGAQLFDQCWGSFCAVRDAMRYTPDGNYLLNAGVMVVRPSATAFATMMAELSKHVFSPEVVTPEQTYLSDYFASRGADGGIQWLSPRYNFGCHDKSLLEPDIGAQAGQRQPELLHACGPNKIEVHPLCTGANGSLLQPTDASKSFAWPCSSPTGITAQQYILDVQPCVVFNSRADGGAACNATQPNATNDELGMQLRFADGCHWCGDHLGCWSATSQCMLDSPATKAQLAREVKKGDSKLQNGDSQSTNGTNATAAAPSPPESATCKTLGLTSCDQKAEVSLAGKSIYMLMLDRFAAEGAAAAAPCGGDGWCGGTLKGVTSKLDYIAGMGFDCVWITPVVQQPGLDGNCTESWCNMSYHGYWAQDLYAIDPRYGTSDELKALSRGLKQRRMCLILDIVINHVRPITSDADLASIRPFNDASHYHTYKQTAEQSFIDYAKWPIDCLIDPCRPGDFECHSKPTRSTGWVDAPYDEQRVLQGWFTDYRFNISMGDLAQENVFVGNELKKWVRHMVRTYDIDALRLDTTPYMDPDFLAEFRADAGVEILGEITASNWSHLASFQRNPVRGNRVLDAVTNFNLYGSLFGGFCGFAMNETSGYDPHGEARVPLSPPDFLSLAETVREQSWWDISMDLDRVSNFVGTHDEARIARRCNDALRVRHALAFSMLWRGISTVYYGTEQDFDMQDNRAALWESGYRTNTTTYQLIAKLNEARKNFTAARADVVSVTSNTLVFSRGFRTANGVDSNSSSSISNGMANTTNASHASLIVFLNNDPVLGASQPRSYCAPEEYRMLGAMLPPQPLEPTLCWVDLMTGHHARADGEGCYVTPDSEPHALVLRTCS